MSYLDIIRKLNNYNDTTSATVSQGKSLENMYFTNDPSYRNAILHKHDLTNEQIDIRIKNVSKTVNEKKIILRPDTIVDIGTYIEFDNKFYIVDEYESNSTSPYCKVVLCNQYLRLDVNNKIPCIVEGESYGVKIFQGNNDFISDTDTKVKITVPRNDVTLSVKPDTRFIFGNSKYGIYRIGDIATYQDGLLVFIAKKDKYRNEDDLENNIAYNGTVGDITPVNYKIEGEDEIRVGRPSQYILSPKNGSVEWSLDEYSQNYAQIKIIDDYTIEVTGLQNGELIELKCIVDSAIELIKEILVVK